MTIAHSTKHVFIDGFYDIDRDIYLEKNLNFIFSENETAVFFYCHCLPSFAGLLSYMISNCGFDAQKIYVLPKIYSAIPSVVKYIKSLGVEVCEEGFNFECGYYDSAAVTAIKEFIRCAGKSLEKHGNLIKRVTLVDDGGFLTHHWAQEGFSNKFDTVSIQQTASGITYLADKVHDIPKIDVARSAAKREFEAHVIATGVVRKATTTVDLDNKRIGVAGVGAIGSALSRELFEKKYKNIVLYDKVDARAKNVAEEIGANVAKNPKKLLNKSDVIFGCTGANFCNKINPDDFLKEKILFSCSSRDKEFLSFLQYAETNTNNNLFGEVIVGARNQIKIENGGFPINFDRIKEWETPNEILIIRNLILASIFQSLTIPPRPKKEEKRKNWVWNRDYLKIEPAIQKYIVKKWFDALPLCDDNHYSDPDDFNDSWWDENSKGLTPSQLIEVSRDLKTASKRSVKTVVFQGRRNV